MNFENLSSGQGSGPCLSHHPDEFQKFELKIMPVLPSGRNSELELENQAKTMPLLPSGQISRVLSPHPQSGRIFGKSVRTKMADFGFFVIRVLQVYSGVLVSYAHPSACFFDLL